MAVSRLLRFGYARPHVFVAALPGGAAARLAVERYAREHGWSMAASPADTDVLAVCGEAPAGWFGDAVTALWGQVPAPRVRVDLDAESDGPAALAEARLRLIDRDAQHADADAPAHRDMPAAHQAQDMHSAHVSHDGHAEHGEHSDHGGHEAHDEHSDHGGHEAHDEHSDHGGHETHDEHEAHDGHRDHDGHAEHGEHSDHDGHGGGHGGHGGHGGGHGGHGGHGGEVAGLPMADRGPDRDGLALDRVDVAVGPLLSGWPAGLRLRVGTQGDVGIEVTVDHEPSAAADDAAFAGTAGAVAAGRLDALAVLLEVCGADGWASRARRIRDALLTGADRSADLTRFARVLRRSRLLRAATDGVAVWNGQDATDRWRAWLDEAERASRGEPVPPLQASVPADALPGVVTGLELGGLRIAVASLVPPVGLARASTEALS